MVLEAGCGVGAQTVTLAERSPDAGLVSVDVSAESIQEARRRTEEAGLGNVEFRQADILALPFAAESFDHIFVCFVLEQPSPSLTATTGRPSSTRKAWPPQAAIQSLATVQREAGGNALIGRQVDPLLVAASFDAVRVSPWMVYVDRSRPELVEGFTRKTFTAMIEGLRQRPQEAGVIDAETFDRGVRELLRSTEAECVATPSSGGGRDGRTSVSVPVGRYLSSAPSDSRAVPR